MQRRAVEGNGFTIDELKRLLAIEITRVDTSFLRSQIEARAALARDLVPGHERIAAPLLQIDRLDLRFDLVTCRPPWWQRVGLALQRLAGGPAAPPPPRFRFAAAGEEGVNVSLALQRDARGRVRFASAEA